MDHTRRALLRWMTGVMEGRGWSAGAWARAAGVTPTNITRFLHDPVNGSMPGTDTLGRLARAAGSEPRFLGDGGREPGGWPPVRRVPVLTLVQVRAMGGLGQRAAEAFLAAALGEGRDWVAVDRPVSRRAFALCIGSRSLNAAGVLPDDRVVLEPPDVLAPRPGDMVVTVHDDSVCGYRFFPPHLLPVSTDPECGPTSVERAEVAGVAVHVARPLRG